MEQPPNQEQAREECQFGDIINRFQEEDFKILSKSPDLDDTDKKEMEKIMEDWTGRGPEVITFQYTIELDNGEEFENSIDKLKALIWEQVSPETRSQSEDKDVKLEPERNRYEGVIVKVRRVNSSESGYDEKFYLDEDGGFSDLKSKIRRNF